MSKRNQASLSASSLSASTSFWPCRRVKIFDSSLKELPDEADLSPEMLASADLLMGDAAW